MQEEIIDILLKCSPNRIDEALDSIPFNEENVESLLVFIIKTDSYYKRDRAVLKLIDVYKGDSADNLIQAMFKNKARDCENSTLIYAFETLDCSSYLDIVVDFAIYGVYIERYFAIEVIRSIINEKKAIKNEVIKITINKLERFLSFSNKRNEYTSVLKGLLSYLINLSKG